MRILSAHVLILLGLMSWTASGNPAQQGFPPMREYRLDVWQTDDGLPQSTVTSIAQTRDGYLWLGTQNGLVRFDGVHFRVFNENNTPAIKNSRIAKLYEDRQGALWISGEQGELLCLRDGRFSYGEIPGKGTPFNYARKIQGDAQGNLWVATCEWQLIVRREDRVAVASENWGLEGLQCAAIATDQRGQLWAASEKELAVLQDGKFKSTHQETNGGNFRVDMTASRSGGVWMLANGRLRRYESGRPAVDWDASAWGDSMVYDLYEDRQSRLWVATMGNGLFRFDPDGTVRHLGKKDGLPTDSVRCVIEDREGNVWVGTESGGLCRLRSVVFQTLDVGTGLSSSQITSLCESTDGSCWIGMDGAGVDQLSTDGNVRHFGPGQGLMNGHVWSLQQDSQGTVWAGTWNGLYRHSEHEFAAFSDGTFRWPVFAIFEDREGGVWLGQQGVGALTRLRGSAPSFLRIPGSSSSLDVRVVEEDYEGNLWVGTQNEGLYVRRGERWRHYGRQEGLGSDAIWCLRAESGGTVWIGTCGGGLSRWRDGSVTTWTTKNGLANDVICQILEDGRGDLWLGSYAGVFRVSKQELERSARESRPVQCIRYGKTDGLPSLECVGGFQPSGLRSRDGRLWFPTVKGLAVVDPDKVPHNSLPPPVLIEGAAADGTTLSAEGSALQRKPGNELLRVLPGKRLLEVHYTALSLTDPSKVRFRYKLEGLEAAWNEAGTKRTADYTYLPPGRYTFRVIACNNDGIWNDEGASLAVAVMPYFWQTPWFTGLMAAAGLAIVAGSVRHTVKRKLQRKLDRVERERALELERGRIASDIHDDLGAGLTEIVILGELAQSFEGASAQATVQADVRRLTEKARALTRSLDEIVWAVNPENDELDQLVSYACNFAQEYLQAARIRCRLEVPARMPEMCLTANVRHNLFMVLKEALNNIVKHAQASEVWIQIGAESGKLRISVKDNGKGFLREAPAAACSDASCDASQNGRRGNGLANMRKRMKRVGGEISFVSEPGEGTQIELILPLVDQ